MLAPPKTLIAVTSGEPAGIGPDICLALARRGFPARIVVLGDRGMLEGRARQLGLDLRLSDTEGGLTPDSIACLHVPLAFPCHAGKLDRRNAPYVISLLDRAIAGCKCNFAVDLALIRAGFGTSRRPVKPPIFGPV